MLAHALSHILAFSLVVVLPIWDAFETRRLKTSRGPRVKIQSYQMTVAWMWVCSAIAVAAFGWKKVYTISFTAREISWLPSGSNGRVLAMAMVIALLVGLLIPAFGARLSSKVAAAFEKRLAPMNFFLPRTGEERGWFALVSISAGICEEILFRGFLTQYFEAKPYQFSLLVALLLSCLFFGTGHLYQGISGVVITAVLGFVYANLFLLTGSLLLPMVVHAVTDLRLLLILRKAGD